ncbi:MAG: hypothetical protein VB115_10875 [Christensenellaceae bacterium]|nr:hypothetical protein [Christensenellaceae bacterium]
MVSLRQDALLLSLRPAGSVRLVPEVGDRRAWERVDGALARRLVERAERALRADAPICPAGALKANPARYIAAAVSRRELLKALLLGACASGVSRYAERAADLIYAIAEESDWSRAPGEGGYPDFTLRAIDADACETGALMALALALMRAQLDALSPLIAARIRWEVERRLLTPLIAREAELLPAEDEAVPRAAAALLTAALLLEEDDRRRWLCIRRLLRLLEAHLNARDESVAFALGLENYLDRAMAVNDCFALLGEASGGEVELRDEPLFIAMARAFPDAHIGGAWFLNSGGASMRPQLEPDRLFRLGEAARLKPLRALAACLNRQGASADMPFDRPSPPLLSQVMDALSRADLMRESARERNPEAVESPEHVLLAARMEGFYVALTGTDNRDPRAHLDAGNAVLFYGGEPVLVDAGMATATHSVPLVNGREQARNGHPAQDAALREGPGYRMLSMDIASAYPREARLSCWQRTWMLAPFEGGVRLMEVFDFDGVPGRAAFRFVTPHRPRLGEGLIALGPVTMSHDVRLAVSVQPFDLDAPARALWGALYLLTLEMPEDAPGGNYAFVFRP